MESSSGSKWEERPPTLPAKQHRRSSVDSDCVFLSHAGLQHQNAGHNVFTESTDCHADQCPVHQRYDPCRHQERFFSDGTPPPVPRKRLTRTLSLPGTNALSLPPLSPLSPLPRCPQNFDNLVYMMAPISDTYIQEETEDLQASSSNAVPSPSFSQLTFDTPDEQLSSLFRNFVDERIVSEGVQHRHLLFLRRVVQSVEDQSLLRVPKRDFSSLQPQDFLLRDGSKSMLIGDKTFYSLHSPKFPERELGLRVLERTKEAPSAHSHTQPPHVNVQEVAAYFQPSIPLKNSTSTMQGPSQGSHSTDCSSSKAPGGSSTEGSSGSLSVQFFLQRGLCVRVERDLPRTTLEDFVKDSCFLQSPECQDYDRRVCVLLLQILMGSYHLYNNSASAAELRPQEILLVWPGWERHKQGNQLKEDASEGQGSKQMEEMKTERVQAFWKRHGSPRVVLMPQSSFASPQPLTFIKSQIGNLIQFCLQPSASQGPDRFRSSYRTRLHRLSSMLRSEHGPQMTEMMSMLQVLLWGPQVSLFSHRGPAAGAVQNWLTVKRALLVMKLAERALTQDQSVLDWEEYMSLKYLSFTDSETVEGAATQLWDALNTESDVKRTSC